METHLTEYIGLLILWYMVYSIMVLYCSIWYYGIIWYYANMVLYGIILYYIVLWYYCIMVLWYHGIMVLWYILFFISFLSAGVAASGNSFSEPVSEKMNMVPMETSSF